MCVVSMVMDEGRRQWPNPWVNPAPDAAPAIPPAWPFPPPPSPFPSEEEIQEFRRLLEQAKKFDTVTGQSDCEDPEKTIWLKGFCKRLREKSEEFTKMADELEAVINET